MPSSLGRGLSLSTRVQSTCGGIARSYTLLPLGPALPLPRSQVSRVYGLGVRGSERGRRQGGRSRYGICFQARAEAYGVCFPRISGGNATTSRCRLTKSIQSRFKPVLCILVSGLGSLLLECNTKRGRTRAESVQGLRVCTNDTPFLARGLNTPLRERIKADTVLS